MQGKNTLRTRITSLFTEFTQSEKNSGLLLIFCTVFSLLLANLFVGNEYVELWHQHLSFSFLDFSLSLSLEEWINDGLMTVFFLMVGLEIERELYEGELHPIKNAIMPIMAAIGGMLVPALIYILFNLNTSTVKGFGIPMATDIAFSLVVLSLVSNKVPSYLKVLLTSLAIIDDIGSILVIAIFYGKEIQWLYLLASFGFFGLLLILNRLKVYRLTPYILLGIVMWYCMLKSGVHATLSGILLAFALPFNYKGEKNPSIRLQQMLHIPVGFLILPIFVLANTAIVFKPEFSNLMIKPHALGIGLGLLLGKPLGIFLSVLITHKFKIVRLPENISWYKLWAMGMSAGIGFTISIFVSGLAFENEALIQSSKLMILLSSFLSGFLAYLMFVFSKRKSED